MCQKEIKKEKDKLCFPAWIFENLYVITIPAQSNPKEQEFFCHFVKCFSTK